MQCRQHVSQLAKLTPQFQAAGAEIVVILGENLERARRYAQILHTPFPILSDPQREVYHRYGLEKAMIIIQQTASLVIDRQGIVRYLKSVTNPMPWLQETQVVLDFVKTMNEGEAA
jgi:peroxiredoxin